MKAILAFAFLVIAAQAATPAYFLGFTEQIGLNSEQMKHGSVCFETVQKVMMDVHQLIQSKKMGTKEVLRSAIVLIEDVEHKLKNDCSIYLHDIGSTFFRNYKGGDLKEVSKKNWNTYSAEIIQQIAMYVDFLAARNDYEAGKTEAYIYQILLGLEQPKVLPAPEYDYTKRVSQDPATSMNEYTKGFYQTLGHHDSKAIQANANCTLGLVLATIQPFVNAMNGFNETQRAPKTTAEKLVHFAEQIQGVAEWYDQCSEAWAFNFQHIGAPILSSFKFAPIHATLSVVHNIAINLPQMKHSMDRRYAATVEGRLFDVGQINAELFMTVFGNIYRHY